MNTVPTIEPYTIEPMPHETQTEYEFNETYNEEPPNRKIPWALIGIGAAVVGGLGLLGLVLFSGRGSSTNTTNNGNTGNNTNRNVTLQFWGAFIDQDTIQPLLDEYNDLNPNVTIEYANRMRDGSAVDSAATYRSDLFRVLSGDVVDIPDIFMVHNSWAHDFESEVQPSLVYDFSTFDSIFYPVATQDFTNNQIVYGAPLWMDTFQIIYNRALLNTIQLNEPPTNWTRFIEAAKALTVRDGNNIIQAGFAAGNAVNVSFYYELLNILFLQNGVNFPQAQNDEFSIGSSSAADSVNFFKQFSVGNNQTWNTNFKNDSAAFLEEDVAMIVAPSWRYRELIRLNDLYNLNIDIGVSDIPQIEGQENKNWSDYWGLMVSKSRPYALESWQFIQWLMEPEQQRKLYEEIEDQNGYFGQIFPRKDMASEQNENDYLSSFVLALPNTESWFMSKGVEIRAIFQRIANETSISASKMAQYGEELEELKIYKGTLRGLTD